mmetsp:Transcript_20374/g.52624  ORF Transcript_20374/g.52624 Transcript_20374/m.52624 type:complete len:289 (-) Transcript_20374:268-1134(-)
MLVQTVCAQWHEEDRAREQGDREAAWELGAARERSHVALAVEDEPREPAHATEAKICERRAAVVSEWVELLQAIVEGAEGEQAVLRHVLCLVCVRLDLRLGRTPACSVARGVVVNLRQHMVERSAAVGKDTIGLIVECADNRIVRRAKPLCRAIKVARAAQQAKVYFVAPGMLANGREVQPRAVRTSRLGRLRQLLESVLCTYLMEELRPARLEEAWVKDSQTTLDKGGDAALVNDRPRHRSSVEPCGELANDENALCRVELARIGMSHIAAHVHRLSGDIGCAGKRC